MFNKRLFDILLKAGCPNPRQKMKGTGDMRPAAPVSRRHNINRSQKPHHSWRIGGQQGFCT
jgi:hypothetical protein